MVIRCHNIYPHLAQFFIWMDSEEVLERNCHQVGGLPCKCLYPVVLRVIYFLCENPTARRPKVVRTVRTVMLRCLHLRGNHFTPSIGSAVL
jgi:hypothetical protein